MQWCRTEEEMSVEKGQPLAVETKSFPQPALSGNGCYYPWVGGWEKLIVDFCGKDERGGRVYHPTKPRADRT